MPEKPFRPIAILSLFVMTMVAVSSAKDWSGRKALSESDRNTDVFQEFGKGRKDEPVAEDCGCIDVAGWMVEKGREFSGSDADSKRFGGVRRWDVGELITAEVNGVAASECGKACIGVVRRGCDWRNRSVATGSRLSANSEELSEKKSGEWAQPPNASA